MGAIRFGTTLAICGLIAGCGAPGAFSPISGAAIPGFGLLGGQSLSGSNFLSAVWAKLAGNRGYITPSDDLLPPGAFAALDADGDGKVTQAEFMRQVSADQVPASAYQPLADAAFDELSAGKGFLTYEDLASTVGRHPSGTMGLSPDSFMADAPGGTMDKAGFERYYPELAGNGEPTESLGGFIVDGYLKVAGWLGSQFMMYYPHRQYTATPASIGLPFENADLTTSDGIDIKAWYIPAAQPTNKAIVWIHGIHSARVSWLTRPEFPAMHQKGYNMVAIDLRNHGQSGGTVTTMGLYEDRDVLAAIRYAEQKGNTEIGLVGNSLGGASVIHAAAESDPDVKAVWDDCAFASFDLAVISVASNMHAPFLNLVAPAIEETSDERLGADMSGGDPDTWIGKISPRPVYIVHGAADNFIFAENSRINYAAAGDPKTLWLVPGAGHGVSDKVDPTDYIARMSAFFGQYLN